MPQHRNIVFTYNNWTNAHLQALRDWKVIIFAFVGEEVGEVLVEHALPSPPGLESHHIRFSKKNPGLGKTKKTKEQQTG